MSVVSYNCTCSDDNSGNQTLAELRARMMRRLGWGAMVDNPPPGVADLLNDFLQNAQSLLYRRYDVLRTERFFSWPLEQGVRLYDLPDNAEARTLATPAAPNLTADTLGGSLASGTYSYRIAAINANGETLASTAASTVVTGPTGSVQVDFPIVVAEDGVSAQTGWRVYGRSADAELLLATVGLVGGYLDTGAATPAGALPTVNTTYLCNKLIDPRKLTWVGVRYDGGTDGTWTELYQGIDPALYTQDTTVEGIPQRYQIRQCIEIWPAPDAGAGDLVLKGHFGLEAFSSDDDRTTIDSELVFMLALANAKAHYRQPDAANYVQQAEVLMKNLVAGAHGTARYLPQPKPRADFVYTAPLPVIPFN